MSPAPRRERARQPRFKLSQFVHDLAQFVRSGAASALREMLRNGKKSCGQRFPVTLLHARAAERPGNGANRPNCLRVDPPHKVRSRCEAFNEGQGTSMAHRGNNLFKRNDAMRALKSARDAGLTPEILEIITKDGTIYRIHGKRDAVAAGDDAKNPWDEVLDAADAKRPA
jgi:hypothetical protein